MTVTIEQPESRILDEIRCLLRTAFPDQPDNWLFNRPASGTSSLVYFASQKIPPGNKHHDHDPGDLNPVPACCIRVYDRYIHWQRYRNNLLRLVELDIPSPRLIRTSSALKLRFSRKPGLILESFLDGPLVDRIELSPDTAGRFGITLAQLHNHTAPWFDSGRHRRPVSRFAERTLRTMKNRLAVVRKFAAIQQPADTSRLLDDRG